MNKHSEWLLISAYIDGEATAEERRLVDSHIDGCGSCRGEMGKLRGAKARMAAASRRAMPADLIDELESRWARPSWMELLRAWWSMPPVQAFTEVMATAIVVLGLWIGYRGFVVNESLPLEPLLAAHSRYAAEGLVPQGDLVASNFSAQLAVYQGE